MALLFGLIHHAELEALPVEASLIEEVQVEIQQIGPKQEPRVASSQKSYELEQTQECHAKHEDHDELGL